jgi:flagellar biosynthesis/type III secretory pathway M-ring protein FliF/YscJ
VEYALAVVVLLVVVALLVARPLVAGARTVELEQSRRQELEAAKEAKYREIRDAELDLRMGKLSPDDHRRVDRELRAEAMAILHELDALEGRAPRA